MTTTHVGGSCAASVSAIVVCFNEEKNIDACLHSVSWCDEIIVVDSFSTDRTVEICRQHTNRVIQRAWAGYRNQKAFAHSQATKDWVLLVDADERVTPELRQEIGQVLVNDRHDYRGYALPRLTFYLERWWRRGGWYPDYTVRLFRRDCATWAGTDPHERVVVEGKVRRLRNPLHHFTYRDMEDHVRRINRFTSVSSQELRRANRRCRSVDALFRPAGRFLRSYFLQAGFMEGFAGFYVAVMAAMYVFLKYAKFWELQLEASEDFGGKRSSPPPQDSTHQS